MNRASADARPKPPMQEALRQHYYGKLVPLQPMRQPSLLERLLGGARG